MIYGQLYVKTGSSPFSLSSACNPASLARRLDKGRSWVSWIIILKHNNVCSTIEGYESTRRSNMK